MHQTGSSNPLGVTSGTYKVPFHLYFSVKDLIYYAVFLFFFLIVTLSFGYHLMDSENFIPANALVTPTHIQPEWYFLFAYAILRSIPNKLGGVLALLASVSLLFVFSVSSTRFLLAGFNHSPLTRILF